MRAWFVFLFLVACDDKEVGPHTRPLVTGEPVESICTDGADDDGDGAIDCEDTDCAPTCDVDGDGFQGEGVGGDDCDDQDHEVHPDAVEVCNGIDDDCDGDVDDADPDVDASDSPWYPDRDADGYGESGFALYQCEPPQGGDAVQVDGDCADAQPDVNPGAIEVCNNRDDDCDGDVDDADASLDPTTRRTWYADADGDGYGDPLVSTTACAPPAGHVDNADDCDDADQTLGLPVDWWLDGDGDGYGVGAPVNGCTAPGVDWSRGGGSDCEDGEPSIHPGAYDVCGDAVDSNCDGNDCTVCTQVRVGLLPGWGSGLADPSLEWTNMLANQGALGACPIVVIDVPANFTQQDLEAQAFTVLWSGDAAGGPLQYTNGEIAAIQGWLAAGNGGLVTTYLWNFSGVFNGALAPLVGVDDAVLLDTAVVAQLPVTVLQPGHPLADGIPLNFNAASYGYTNGSTQPIVSSLLPDTTVVFASQDDTNLAVAYDPGGHRGVAFTTFIEYASTNPAATWQLMYNAAYWASGY